MEWLRRNQNDQKTYGELFFMACDDIHDMTFIDALKSLMALFVGHLMSFPVDSTKLIKSKLHDWMLSQASFIQALFADFNWES